MKSKITAIFLGLAILLFSSLLVPAHAQSALNAMIQQRIANCDAEAKLNSSEAVQERMAAAHGVFGNEAQLDATLYYCIDQIENALDLLEGTGAYAGAPLIPSETNPFVNAITGFVENMAFNILIGMLRNLCTVVAEDIKQFEMFALSQVNRLCIPLPKLNLSIGGIHLPMAQCHGVNLAGPLLNAIIPGVFPAGGAGKWNMWNFHAH